MGRAKDGRVIEYGCYGSRNKFEEWQALFTVEAYVELQLFRIELARIMLDAMCACDGKDIAYVSFYDFQGGSMIKVLGAMEYGQASGQSQNLISPYPAGSVQILVNFPHFWRTCLNMITAG